MRKFLSVVQESTNLFQGKQKQVTFIKEKKLNPRLA